MRRSGIGLRVGLCAWLGGCVDLDESPSMQAELRSAKSELVAATKDVRAAAKDLQRAADELKEARGETTRPVPTGKPVSVAVAKASAAVEGADEAIRCDAWPRCEVDRKFLNRLLKNEMELAEQFAARPVRSGGKLTGYRLTAIRTGSLPNLLQLRSGDRIEVIAGVKLDHPKALDEALEAVRGARRVTARIARGDGVVTLVLVVKKPA